ncbi:ABC transporter permease [Larkinella arboricola]
MLTNYLKIAWRNLLRNWGFSAINVLGLTVGVTACLLISLYVRHELSYDQFHQKASRVYRLVTDIKTPTETINTESTAFAMANAVKTGLPEVEQAVRLLNRGMLVQRGEHKFQEDRLLYADSALFEVFSFPLLKGNPRTALVAPFSVVLTEKAALKYFGNEDPIGKALMLDGQNSATVTGVVADVPDNSHVKFDILVSMATLTRTFAPGIDDQWGNFGPITYLLLKEHTNAAAVTSRLPDLLERRAGSFMKQNKMQFTLLLEPLTDVYLRSPRHTQGTEGGSLTNIYVFSIVAGFILLIACINFMNLVIARSSERAKEVGVRKVVGAVRSQLTGQFLSESVLLSFIAFILAGILCELLLPAFNTLSGKIISHSLFTDGTYWLTLLGLAALVGGFAGIYPALVLSSFKPIAVLKGRFVSSSQGILLRRTLVVVQFMISVSLTIGTLVAYRQLNFMRNQQLGFQKDQTLVVSLPDRDYMLKNQRALRNQMATLPGVQAVTVSSHLPGGGSMGAYTEIENKMGEMQAANMGLYSVDFDFLPQYGVKVVAGRVFSPKFSTDSTQALVINEAAARALGYHSPDQIIGKRFSQWGRKGQIIGVVKDFHTSSLRERIEPLTLRIEPSDFSLFSLKVKGADVTETIRALERFWKTAVPQRPFDYYFLDQAFDKQYRAEERFGKLFLYFSGLAIFIACLGLFGLTSYTTVQRTKEIGVRKVLGASVPSIVLLLSKDFLKLVLIAVILAAPVAWWAMDTWLRDFAYRINVEWWILVLAGVLAIAIAFLTVSFQSIKAALTNPVKSLRTE